MSRVLGVFAKLPQPGKVKTRLAQKLGAEAAARLYEAFLRDSLARLQSVSARRVVAYTPAEGRGFFEALVAGRFELEEQSAGDLGERMRGFFESQFSRGARHVVLVGSDTPDLPIGRIDQAFAELARREIVFGPSDDGGYYLVGMSQMIAAAFQGIDWLESNVLIQTIQAISRLPVRLTLLEPWHDIDRVRDLTYVSARIGAARRAGEDPGLPHTEAALRHLAGSQSSGLT